MALVHGPITGQHSGRLTGRLLSGLAVLIALTLMVIGMFLPVVQSSDATATGYTIRRHQQELADLQASIHRSEAQVAQLGTMSRIRDEAARLGFGPSSRAGVNVSVPMSPSDQLFLPRRYLPKATPEATPSGGHGLLWTVLHALPFH